MSIAIITLAYMHVEVTMREHKLIRIHSETKKNTWGKKQSRNLLKRHTKNIIHFGVVYEVLTKPGSCDIHPKNGRIHGNTRLF